MLTEPQPSVAVATPVALVVVTAGQSRTRFPGAVIIGGVVSCTVMVWSALALVPHWSVAVQVRAMTLVLAQLVVTTSLKAMLTVPQPSVAVAAPVALVVVTAGHSSTRSIGTVRLGGVMSRTLIIWMALMLLLH